MGIKDFEKGFHEGLREFQMREVGLILEGVDAGEDIILRRSLRRGYTT